MSKNENPIQTLGKQLAKDCPDATLSMDKPKQASGVWFLGILRNGHSVNVQWQAK